MSDSTEVAEKFLPAGRWNAPRQDFGTGPRCGDRTNWSAGNYVHPPRQHDGLEGIQQDAQDCDNSGDGGENMHQAMRKYYAGAPRSYGGANDLTFQRHS